MSSILGIPQWQRERLRQAEIWEVTNLSPERDEILKVPNQRQLTGKFINMAKAMQLAPLPAFSPEETSNLAQKWAEWKESFQYFIEGSGITDEKQKKAILLHQAGMEVQRIFRTLTVASDSYANTVKALDEHFMPKKNVAYERHVFRQACQGPSESMDVYLTRLKNLIKSCDYPDSEVQFNLRDQIIEKCFSKKLRVRFLREKNLTLDSIVEMAESQARQIEEDSVKPRPTEFKVNKVNFHGKGGKWEAILI